MVAQKSHARTMTAPARACLLAAGLIPPAVITPAHSLLAASGTDHQPTAIITTLGGQGMAPLAVHVHALNADLPVGSFTTARFEWDFGDEQNPHNRLEGFNAAHLYTQPGQYLLTLRVTSEARLADSASIPITVLPDLRRAIYVAADGDDAASGHSPQDPLRTLPRAFELLDDDARLLLRRGDEFDLHTGQTLQHANVLIGAYGSGPRPSVRWTGPPGCDAILKLAPDGVHDTVIESIRFDSIHDTRTIHDVVDAVIPAGVNTTIRDCRFGAVSCAINGNRSPVGLLALHNAADDLATYFAWVQGSDHTYLANTVLGSHFEHVIRLGGAQRVLIAGNDLTNDPKTTIWSMLGRHCTVRGNVLHDGRLAVGPDPSGGGLDQLFQWITIEHNILLRSGGINAACELLPGAEHVMIRNNVITSDDRSCISVAGFDPATSRRCVDVAILNNTGINGGTHGRFVHLQNGAADLALINNLYVAPRLITGAERTANVYIEDEKPTAFLVIRNNAWAIPDQFQWIPDVYHYLWPYWSHPDGYLNRHQWAGLPPVSDELYERVRLDGDYAPPVQSLAATHARAAPGVFTDLYGRDRPGDGAWSAGAVEAAMASDPWADLAGDTAVDLSDLLMMLEAWGDCPRPPGACPADFDHNGAVGVADLLLLLARWNR